MWTNIDKVKVFTTTPSLSASSSSPDLPCWEAPFTNSGFLSSMISNFCCFSIGKVEALLVVWDGDRSSSMLHLTVEERRGITEIRVHFELPKKLRIEWPSPGMEDIGFVPNPKNASDIAMSDIYFFYFSY